MTPEQLDKNNAEFEAMMADKYPFHDLTRLSNGSYLDIEVWHLHRGWELSRESIVVELPAIRSIDCSTLNNSVHINYYSQYGIHDALQSAGINYREKE